MTRARALTIVVTVIVLLLADRGLTATRRQFDLTENNSLTLSDETRRVLAQVDDRVRVTAFLHRSQPGRAEAASLLDRYRRRNRRISWQLLDPDQAPGEAQRLGIDTAAGGMAMQMGERIERSPTVTEQDITSGLARLLRNVSPGVCMATGHGESDPRSKLGDGFAAATGALVANGYRIKILDLLVQPTVPKDCEALVLANPLASLGPAEASVVEYLAAGGSALVLSDPASTAVLTPLLEPYGIGIERGLLLEGDPEARLGNDPFTAVVREYRSGNPAVRRLPPTVYAGAQAVTVDETPREGLSVAVLARTTQLAYLERQPRSPNFDPAEDLQGPHAIVAAADYSESEGGAVLRTRLIVVGDVDFATTDFIGDGGNSQFLVQAMDWLTLDEDLVSVRTNLPDIHPLALTGGRLRYARLLSSVGIPLGFLLVGALVWAMRRGR